jgi:hypothetical protein
MVDEAVIVPASRAHAATARMHPANAIEGVGNLILFSI